MNSDLNKLLDSSLIRVLLTISETGSFSRAAIVLGVSQPSISQQVRRVEQYVGRRLFKRSRRGVEFTMDGRSVLVYANAISSLTDRLREQLESANGEYELTAGMSEDFCRTALPSVLRLFIVAHPNVRVRVISGTYETLTTAINSGAIEFAIFRRNDQFPDAETIFTDQLVWFGSQMLSLPIEDPVPLVLPLPTNPSRVTVIDVLRAAGRQYSIRFESIGMAGMEMAIGAGLGVCAGPFSMPLFTASPLADKSGLPRLPLAEYVLAKKSRNMSIIGDAFAKILRKSAVDKFLY